MGKSEMEENHTRCAKDPHLHFESWCVNSLSSYQNHIPNMLQSYTHTQACAAYTLSDLTNLPLFMIIHEMETMN